MFLLDTNVVPELLRPSPETIVAHWVGNRQTTEIYFSAIGEAEFLDYPIAVIARSRHMKIVTRNSQDLEGLDVDTVNPWTVN